MNTSDKKAKMADPLAAAHAGGRIVLSAEELFALSVQLARRIENDPATLRALAEARTPMASRHTGSHAARANAESKSALRSPQSDPKLPTTPKADWPPPEAAPCGAPKRSSRGLKSRGLRRTAGSGRSLAGILCSTS
jgi:hypothetical protein